MIGIDKSQAATHDSIIPSKPRVPPAAIVAMAISEMMKIRMLIILTSTRVLWIRARALLTK